MIDTSPLNSHFIADDGYANACISVLKLFLLSYVSRSGSVYVIKYRAFYYVVLSPCIRVRVRVP